MKTVWFVRDVEGTKMKIVNLPFIYQLGTEMHQLLRLEYKARFDIMLACVDIKSSIERLLNEYPVLTTCRKPGEELLYAINKNTEWFHEMKLQEKPDWNIDDATVDYWFREVLKRAKNFETVLKADLLENFIAYHPQQKALYSTSLLITHAERALHVQDLKKLKQKTIQEIRESGKCLAFDNYTASGFHMLRALELVLHEYYVLICKPENSDKPMESWSGYLNPLYKLISGENTTLNEKEKSHVKKVYYLLQQIKELDRNNIMHPEVFLNEAEALKLFNVANTAIMEMAETLPDQQQIEET